TTHRRCTIERRSRARAHGEYAPGPRTSPTQQPPTGDATHQPTRAVRAAVTGPPTRNHLETHMAEHTNVVITGLGTTNPLGGDVTSTWAGAVEVTRSEEHTSELQSRFDLVCRLLLEKKKNLK